MTINFFKRIFKYWDIFVLLILTASYIYVFSTLSVLRHQAFASSFDLANMGQTVWNTIHGRPFALTGVESTISRFSIHADLILVFLSPFYFLRERVTTLLMIQSTFIGLGAIPVYFLSKKVLASLKKISPLVLKILSLNIVLAYLLNPGVQWTNIYDFHGVSLAIPFLLSAFYFAYTKRWLGFFCFVFLALLTKEQISLFIAIFGLIIAFVFKEKKIGMITFLLGVSWFTAMIFWIIPAFSENGKYWALNWLSLANLKTTGLSTMSPFDLFKKFTISSDALNYYLILLKPLGFLPLLGLPWLVLSSSDLAINLFSTQAQMRSIYFHYDSGITPALFIATIFAFKYIYLIVNYLCKKIDKGQKRLPLLAVYLASGFLLFASLRTNYHYSPLPTTPSCWCLMYQVTQEDIDFAKILRDVPSNATITSSSEIRAHLTRRENSFNLPSATDSAQYVAILNQNRVVGDYEPKPFENALIKVLLSSKDHNLVYSSEHFYLFKRK